MPVVSLHSKAAIERVLRRNTALHIYALGDLDDFFWPYTTWYGLATSAGNEAVLLVYSGSDLPTLLALDDPPADALQALLSAARHLLPARLYAHLTPQCVPLLTSAYHVESHGEHHKMLLTDPARLATIDTSQVVQLSVADQPAIDRLYAASYPGNWFDPRMLQTGCYYGLRSDDQLVSIAGVHVFSAQYRVAALGNITTHPAFRGRGFASAVTARLCHALRASVDQIGLNVAVANTSAIACYTKLGFAPIAVYEECALRLRQLPDEALQPASDQIAQHQSPKA